VDDILTVTLFLADVCRRLGIEYCVGGSLASSLHGIPRSTQGVDLVVAMHEGDVEAFAAELRGSFYLDEDAMREAVRQRRSFNVIHLGSYFKADVFVTGEDEASRLQMARRQRFTLDVDPPREIVVSSPEDVVVQKLAWYSLGDESSERQWRDAQGVLKVRGKNLDMQYLLHAAALLEVEALLDRALQEAAPLS
jgi:hypothetical protein